LNGSDGFIINGVAEEDRSGGSVSSAGDVNGDGIDDLIIGATGVDPDNNSRAGSSYVVFGSDISLPNPFNLTTINGTNGFIINGVAGNDFLGVSVSSAGDINGDGIDDLILGASQGGVNTAGSIYVVFGSDVNGGLPNPFNLTSLDGTNGFSINGLATSDNFGVSVNSAGDVNGDGIDDLIIGANGASANTGSSYVVFGSNVIGGLPHLINLASLDGTNGFSINGVTTDDASGESVSSAGDINGDGIDDIIIGAIGADPGSNERAGSSYVVFGSNIIGGLPHPFNLSSLDGSNGFALHGIGEFDQSGSSVSRAGDINGDDIDDLIIGAKFADATGNNDFDGSSYVVFGSNVDGGLPHPFNLSSINGINGFTLNGADESGQFGVSVSTAGDVNGDGMDDLIIGADGASANTGSSYVVFGSNNLFPHPFNLTSLDGKNGFVLNGVSAEDRSGSSVNAAGDVNNDGIDDIIIGAIFADPGGNSSAGSSYVVYGKNDTLFKDGFE
jgi:hypothetical protein